MKKKAAKQPAKDDTSFASINELEVAFTRSPGKGWENLDCKLTHIHNITKQFKQNFCFKMVFSCFNFQSLFLIDHCGRIAILV